MNRIIESDYFLFLIIVGWQGAIGTLSPQDEPATIVSLYTVVKSPWKMHRGREKEVVFRYSTHGSKIPWYFLVVMNHLPSI